MIAEYSFLRNLWTHRFKDFENVKLDNEDRIDRLNKIVVMIKTRVVDRVNRESESSNQGIKKYGGIENYSQNQHPSYEAMRQRL